MALRRHLVLLLFAMLGSLGAGYRTTNFLVDAPTPQIAQQIGDAAERYRKEKALLWLGTEMPSWPEPCPLKAKVTLGGAGGATSFVFDQGRILGQRMEIEGGLDRLLASVLPHEVTHTVFAHYFRTPVPRWADEGGSVLSEDELEKSRHDQLVRQILNSSGRAMPLRRLFTLKDYPGDVMVLYAEGFSVAQFLVDRGGRQTFLKFIAQGMRENWDNAVRTSYRYQNVEELEQAWLTHLRATRRQPVELARNNQQQSPGRSTNAAAQWAQNTTTGADPAQRAMVRQTVPPMQPQMTGPGPVFRGQSPEAENVRGTLTVRPGYLPDVPGVTPPKTAPTPPAPTSPRDLWQPVGTVPAAPASQAPPPPFRLGTPVAIQPATSASSQVTLPPAPIGYPR